MAGYIRYANQNATRNQPLDEELIKKLAYLEKMGVTAEVFSGGQPGKDEGGPRVGSERHDHGGAGDMFFYKDGRKLDWNNPDDLPVFQEIVRVGKQNGITGFGAGDGYMQPGSMHVGGGNAGVWGKDGSGKNAAPWLADAYNGAQSPKVDPVAEVVAAAPPTASAEPPKKPESNGIFFDVLSKMTGKEVKMPEKIFGQDTKELGEGFSAFGDFAKIMAQQDQNLNNQIAAASRAGRRQNTPIEQQFIPTIIPQKKKRGGISGLGGYLV